MHTANTTTFRIGCGIANFVNQVEGDPLQKVFVPNGVNGYTQIVQLIQVSQIQNDFLPDTYRKKKEKRKLIQLAAYLFILRCIGRTPGSIAARD